MEAETKSSLPQIYLELNIDFFSKIKNIENILCGSYVFNVQDNYEFTTLYYSKNKNKFNISSHPLSPENLRNINDHFILILYDKSQKVIHLINDRFASIPLYYIHKNNTLYLSTIINHLFPYSSKKISNNIILEFFHYQRLYNNSSLIEDIKFLEASTILSLDTKENLSITKYWLPSFRTQRHHSKDNILDLASILKTIYQNFRTNESQNTLLLSGGIDSRCLLPCQNIHSSLTLCSYPEAREVKVARRLASLYSIPHHTVVRNDSIYFKQRKLSSLLGSGASNIMHAHFFAIPPINTNTTYIHGHGFDYFFQGMYLPQKKIQVLGRNSLHSIPINIDYHNLADYFAKNIKFKCKSISISNLINLKSDDYFEIIKSPLKKIISSYEKLDGASENTAHLWDYIIAHNLSRHYTSLNLRSMENSINSHQLTLSWDNELLDFYFSIPWQEKINATLLKKTLLYINPELGKTTNANINLPANWSGFLQSSAHFLGLSAIKVGLKNFGPPPKRDRSWPDMNDILRTNDWSSYLEKTLKNGKWKELDLFNVKKVQTIINNHLENKGNFYDFIFSLITLELFLDDLWE
jgi:asparagine synthetase B (glutamine-hydrolysing)